jgi:hypothetical protein
MWDQRSKTLSTRSEFGTGEVIAWCCDLETTISHGPGQRALTSTHQSLNDSVSKTVFDRLFHGRIIPQNNEFAAMMETQASIGWMPIFRG